MNLEILMFGTKINKREKAVWPVAKFELDNEAAAAVRPEWASPERWLNSVSGQGSERLEFELPVFLELVARLDFGLYGFRWLQVFLLLCSPERPDK